MQNHMNREMKVCPYNAKHVHPAAEHQFHLVHCPDRNIIDRDIVYGMKLVYKSVLFVFISIIVLTNDNYNNNNKDINTNYTRESN